MKFRRAEQLLWLKRVPRAVPFGSDRPKGLAIRQLIELAAIIAWRVVVNSRRRACTGDPLSPGAESSLSVTTMASIGRSSRGWSYEQWPVPENNINGFSGAAISAGGWIWSQLEMRIDGRLRAGRDCVSHGVG